MPLAPTRPMSRFMITLAMCLAMSKARGGGFPKWRASHFGICPPPPGFTLHMQTHLVWKGKLGIFVSIIIMGKYSFLFIM